MSSQTNYNITLISMGILLAGACVGLTVLGKKYSDVNKKLQKSQSIAEEIEQQKNLIAQQIIFIESLENRISELETENLNYVNNIEEYENRISQLESQLQP